MAAVKNLVLHVLYMDPLFGTEHCRGASLAMGQSRHGNCEAAGSDPNMSHSQNCLKGPGLYKGSS